MIVNPAQPPPLEMTQIATALRLGWYFTELRGRHDDAVYRAPRPPVIDTDASLCLGDERSRADQADEVAAIVDAAAGTLGADPDTSAFEPTGAPPTGIRASKALDTLCERLGSAPDGPSRDQAWRDLEVFLASWDEEIQKCLAVASPRVSAAYRLGRALSDIRWSLHPAELDAQPHGWRFLIGPWRSSMLARLIDRLSPYFNDKLTPVALRRSVAGWAAVVPATDLISATDAPRLLARQSDVWHDLLLSERSGSDLINHSVASLVRTPSVLLLALKPFRFEIALLAFSLLGLMAASWLVLTNTPASPSRDAPAAQSVVQLAQNVGGRGAVSAVLAVMSLFGITLAGVSARARARLQDIVQGIRHGIDTELVADAATLLPATTWPLPPEGNLYLRFATLRQRSQAVLVDWLLLLVCDLIVIFAAWLLLSFFAVGQLALRNTVVVVTLVMAWLYFTGWPAGSGRGIGMWTQRMRILDARAGWVPDGRQTMKRALAVLVPFEMLAIAFWLWPLGLAAAPILVGVAWVAILCWTVAMSPDKRGWHDHWTGTVVVAATDPAYDFATVARQAPAAPPAPTPEPAPAAPLAPLPAPAAPIAAAPSPAVAEPTPASAGKEA